MQQNIHHSGSLRTAHSYCVGTIAYGISALILLCAQWNGEKTTCFEGAISLAIGAVLIWISAHRKREDTEIWNFTMQQVVIPVYATIIFGCIVSVINLIPPRH